MLSVMPLASRTSPISNPQSAVTLSPDSNRSNTPDFSVIALSEILPPHSSETNVITPPGLIPISALKVL